LDIPYFPISISRLVPKISWHSIPSPPHWGRTQTPTYWVVVCEKVNRDSRQGSFGGEDGGLTWKNHGIEWDILYIYIYNTDINWIFLHACKYIYTHIYIYIYTLYIHFYIDDHIITPHMIFGSVRTWGIPPNFDGHLHGESVSLGGWIS
jgi:hypothetical protein